MEEAAERLWKAAESRVPCVPVRDLLAGRTVADAYEIAQANVLRAKQTRDARVVGWKVGITSKAVQQQLGVQSPDFGALLSDCAYGEGEPIPLSRLLQPRVEAEVAFILGASLQGREMTGLDVIRATEFIVPALEIVDSRIQQWDITLLDTVADNASSGLFVSGLRPTRLADVDLGRVNMSLAFEQEVASEGTGSACLGHPINAVTWLANTLIRMGTPLQAGDVVLSGALGPMVTVTTPGTFELSIDGLGGLRTEFIEE